MEKNEGLYPQVPGNQVPQQQYPTAPMPAPTVMSTPASFGPNSATLTCPYCHKGITTLVRAESSSKTHLFAVLLCFVSCCCIPYFMDSCKNKNHYCPSCNAFLGAYTN
ncbi:hypothetical protein PPYR_09944 [Photinus pyralis]|uniref:LITAF domain-containing protein n=1 Tax=Photinus pyralis TaxID=7054 RepID=A0A1Y1LRZ0_PHOPY|nr:lipopolysaccharide-induced tumor necrosis factor-alpha factor homolog [Photinus pyralis]KAB0795883.1 hypothetical protein PPYR_09944 [Photinus pyralis]